MDCVQQQSEFIVPLAEPSPIKKKHKINSMYALNQEVKSCDNLDDISINFPDNSNMEMNSNDFGGNVN